VWIQVGKKIPGSLKNRAYKKTGVCPYPRWGIKLFFYCVPRESRKGIPPANVSFPDGEWLEDLFMPGYKQWSIANG
jgi:hypothetical protein